MLCRTYQLPHQGAFLGFFDEVDAASGAHGDWRRDPDGDDGDAGDVRPKLPGMAMPAIRSTKRWKSST